MYQAVDLGSFKKGRTGEVKFVEETAAWLVRVKSSEKAISVVVLPEVHYLVGTTGALHALHALAEAVAFAEFVLVPHVPCDHGQSSLLCREVLQTTFREEANLVMVDEAVLMHHVCTTLWIFMRRGRRTPQACKTEYDRRVAKAPIHAEPISVAVDRGENIPSAMGGRGDEDLKRSHGVLRGARAVAAQPQGRRKRYCRT